MSEFKIKHIGIRTDSAEDARKTAELLAALFDLSGTRETDTAVWAGELRSDEQRQARPPRTCGHADR